MNKHQWHWKLPPPPAPCSVGRLAFGKAEFVLLPLEPLRAPLTKQPQQEPEGCRGAQFVSWTFLQGNQFSRLRGRLKTDQKLAPCAINGMDLLWAVCGLQVHLRFRQKH